MHLQKGRGYMKGFKNPALSRENDVLTGHCIICGKYIGNEYDTSFYALIRRKYCKEHADEAHDIKMAIGRKDYKARQTMTVRAAQSLCDQYRRQTVIQQEFIAELQRELDDLKRRR